MGLEATLVCVDNSEWMRNGDFIPTRLQSQQDAVNVVTQMKTRLNAENAVGLLSLADTQVHVTLTNDTNKIFKALQMLEPKGSVNFITGIRIAHLALKHRQNKNLKMRIIAFIGSPVTADEKEVIRLAKRLKKEKVNVDIISFGETEENSQFLGTFIDTINGKDKLSRLVTAQPGPLLSEVLLSSPIFAGEDGAPIAPMGQGFDFGFDPSEDPELAMALRVSMEEQRQRQEEDARRVQTETMPTVPESMEAPAGLAQAGLAELPYDPDFPSLTGGGLQVHDVTEMTEEEQLAMALQMSMQAGLEEDTMDVEPQDDDGSPDVEEEEEEDEDEEEDKMADDDMVGEEEDRAYLHSVLSSLPGVNPEEALQNLELMTQAAQEEREREKEEGDGEEDS